MKKKIMIIFSTLFFFTQLECETEILEEDDDFKIVFDLEEIYPLVDYDTICTDYEIQDFIDNSNVPENILIKDTDQSDNLLIPDLPQAPESIAMVTVQEIEQAIPVPVIVNDIQEKVDTCNLKKHRNKKKESKKSKICKKRQS
jgi:hypothetical protein